MSNEFTFNQKVTRSGRWFIPLTGTSHNTSLEASEHASNYSGNNNGVDVEIVPPSYVVSCEIEAVQDIPMPVPVPDPSPQPEPDKPRFDMLAITDTLLVGSQIQVPVINISDNETIFFHIFDIDWNLIHRKTESVVDGSVVVTIPPTTGQVRFQLQYIEKAKETKLVTIEHATVPPQIDPPTQEGEYTAIARWATVPHQVIEEGYKISVAAYHIYGIDRVEFKVLDRNPIVVSTKTDGEYVTTLNNLPSGKITVDAIAYPINGQPRQLKQLVLFSDVQHPIIELSAGTHKLSGLSLPSEGWFVIRPKSNVSKKDCIITGIDRLGSGNLNLKGVTIKLGQWGDIQGDKDSTWLWLDDCDVSGNGWENSTRWVANLLSKQFYTDCSFSEFSTLFHGGGGELFAKNITASDIHEDVFRAMGYAANVVVDGVNVRNHPQVHPDLFDFAAAWFQRNVVFQDIKIANTASQGFAGANMEDVAFIDCDVQAPGWSVMQIGGTIRHLLIDRTVLNGGARFRDAQPEGVVLRDSKIGWQEPFLPENYDQEGIEVQP